MTKEETNEFNELSLQCFGNKYAWKKLRTKGLRLGNDRESGYPRMSPLTLAQVKTYMIKTMEMRAQIEAQIEKDKASANNPE